MIARFQLAGLLLAIVVSGLAGCASDPGASPTPGTPVAQVRPAAPGAIDREIEARILALDPEHVSDSDVRQTLVHGPTPRILLFHGGVYPVHLLMESFATFLTGMGYPENRIRTADGSLSFSPYGDAARQAGEIAWYYEREGGPRPMMVGHSQGGIQAIKVLHALAGVPDPSLRVFDPAKGEFEERTTIVDPITGGSRPVVGLSFSYISVVGTGGWSLALPNHWSVATRIRAIPDNVESFTGYRIGFDLFAMDGPGLEGVKTFFPVGRAEVRNVTLPAVYSHVFVPGTAGLAADPAAREWINAFVPKGEQVGDDPPEFAGRNILWAADVWWNIKKHWVLEEQRTLRERRRLTAGAPAPVSVPATSR